MNERIRELYIQSINMTNNSPADDINPQIAEKFAELIVQECCNKITENSLHGGAELVKRMNRHFGVLV